MRRLLPALCLLCACRSDTGIVPDKGEEPGGETGLPADTGEGCADAEEPYNGVDDDCDPATPDDDLDGDGHALADDCDDADAAVHPGATEVCNGIDDDCDGTVDGVAEGYGDTAVCPAVDCADVLAVRPGATDGVYWIGEDGDATTDPFEARCDMATDGGGWTLVLSLNAARMTQYDGADVLETGASVGVVDEENHLSEGFYRLSFTESYVVDGTHGVPVPSDVPWGGGTIGDDIAAQLAGTPSATAVWSAGSRSRFLLRSSTTTDGVFSAGDMRVHFILNQADAPDLGAPVTTEYRAGEHHLVFDSDFGYAGGRIYTDPLYDIAAAGVDEPFHLYVR